MIFAALAAAPEAGKVASGIGHLLGGLVPNKKDAQRVANAQALLTRALAGDSSAVAELVRMQKGSATSVGKKAAAAALDALRQHNATFNGAAFQPNQLQLAVGQSLDKVRDDLASGVQNIGNVVTSGATRAVAADDSANAGAVSLGTNTRTLYMAGLAVFALVVVVLLFRRK